jgi:hypothetical protein
VAGEGPESTDEAGEEVARLQAIAPLPILLPVVLGLDVVPYHVLHLLMDAENQVARQEDELVTLVPLLSRGPPIKHKIHLLSAKIRGIRVVREKKEFDNESGAAVSLHAHLRQLPVETIGESVRKGGDHNHHQGRGDKAI